MGNAMLAKIKTSWANNHHKTETVVHYKKTPIQIFLTDRKSVV